MQPQWLGKYDEAFVSFPWDARVNVSKISAVMRIVMITKTANKILFLFLITAQGRVRFLQSLQSSLLQKSWIH